MSLNIDIEKHLGDFSLKVKLEAADEVIALLGASGCGKSMTLKCIAGIEKPDKGSIVLDGRTLFDSDKHINITPQKRHTGLLFQNYALFPNMTVIENIRAGAKREQDPHLRQRKVADIMQSFGLSELSSHYPAQLSGGQQQRTALARILVSSPQILLLDEPFSALDSHLRFRLEQEVRDVITQFGKTVVLVSHDRDEVFRLSEKIAIMNNGQIETFGTKKEVFSFPRTANAAKLTGCKNISPIRIIDAQHVQALDWNIQLETADVVSTAAGIGIRMHDICAGSGANSFLCDVISEIENPFSYTVMLKPAGKNCEAMLGWEVSKQVWNQLRASQTRINIPPQSLLLLQDQVS